MLKLLIVLSALTFGVCYSTPNCNELHKNQLSALNERMSQMIDALYSSPLLAKLKPSRSTASTPSVEYTSSTSSDETPTTLPAALPAYMPAPTPSVFYMPSHQTPSSATFTSRLNTPVVTSLPQSYYTLEGMPMFPTRPPPSAPQSSYYTLDAGVQPTEYGYPTPSHHTRRSVWPHVFEPYPYPHGLPIHPYATHPSDFYSEYPPLPFLQRQYAQPVPSSPYPAPPPSFPAYSAQPNIQPNYM